MSSEERTPKSSEPRTLAPPKKDGASSNADPELAARSLAHDLAQPLGAICNFAELIKDQTDGDVHRYAERIREIAARTAAQIRDRLGKPETDEKP